MNFLFGRLFVLYDYFYFYFIKTEQKKNVETKIQKNKEKTMEYVL